MRRQNRLFVYILSALACLLVLAMLRVPIAIAQEDTATTEASSKSAVDAPAKTKKKTKKKKAAEPKKEEANPVNSSDLMNSMRQTLLQPGSPTPPPPPVATVPSSAPPSSAPLSAPEPTPAITPQPRQEMAAPAAPAAKAPPYVSSSTAPVLTDTDEPPSVMGGGPLAAPPPQQSERPPAVMPEAVAESGDFSASRPLFSKKGGKKRSGVVKKARPAPAASPILEPAPAEQKVEQKSEPEISTPPAKTEPPKTSPTATVDAPAPPPADGAVVYSQKAGEKAAPPVAAAAEKSESAAAPAPESDTLLVPDNSAAPAAAKPAPSMAEAKPVISPAPAATATPVIESRGSTRASCGAANGVGSPAKPTSNLCTEGKPSDVTGKGPWRWTCKGEKGRVSVSCAAPLLVNGECGLASGSQTASAPLPKQLCSAGKANEVSGSGPWYWTCSGENGGVVAQCAAYTLIKGACGPASGAVAETAPASGLCSSGRETPVMGDGPWTWTCAGSGEGMTANCMAMAKRDGTCGPAADTGSIERPSTNLCSSGRASAVTGDGPWNWSCMGDNGGGSANCAATVVHDSACGVAHGVGALTAPTEGLCSEGRASEVGGDGPWAWTCYGDNGGARVNCMAPRKLDGECGPASHMETEKAPSADLCFSGTPGAVMGSGPWRWTCEGAGGGLSINCTAQRPAQAACGTAQGVASPTPPASGLCSAGTSTSVIGSGPWLWSCEGPQHSAVVNCMAPLQVNGACGSVADIPVSKPPTSGLCSAGIPTPVAGEGPWGWSCQGSGGGSSTSCRTLAAQMAPPPAPPPPPPTVSPAAEVPPETVEAGNECTPTVRRWTITCQQGGYPSSYAGVIVGETQVLCPTGVERGVWLSNSCSPASTSTLVSPAPGALNKTPPPPRLAPVTDVLPDIEPLPAGKLQPSAPRLATPRFKNAAADTSIVFAHGADGLDGNATHGLDEVAAQVQGRDKAIITLNAYAAMPSSNDAQDAQRLSLARALAVRGYLMSHGVANNQIDIHALGPAGDSLGDDRVDIKITSP